MQTNQMISSRAGYGREFKQNAVALMQNCGRGIGERSVPSEGTQTTERDR
jgi:hypothetical protein